LPEEPIPEEPLVASDASLAVLRRELGNTETELLRAIPIEELGLSVRAKQLATRMNWRNALDIACAPAAEALGRKNVGRGTVAELRSILQSSLDQAHDGGVVVRADGENLQADIEAMLGSLDERAASVLRERFGLWDGVKETLEDLGYVFGVTRERIRQVEAKALRRLRESRWRRPGLVAAAMLRQTMVEGVLLGRYYGVTKEEELEDLFDVDRAEAAENSVTRVQLIALKLLEEAFCPTPESASDRLLRGGDGLFFHSEAVERRFLVLLCCKASPRLRRPTAPATRQPL
jgi:hypothetical protein